MSCWWETSDHPNAVLVRKLRAALAATEQRKAEQRAARTAATESASKRPTRWLPPGEKAPIRLMSVRGSEERPRPWSRPVPEPRQNGTPKGAPRSHDLRRAASLAQKAAAAAPRFANAPRVSR